jgi:hypothetical protein
MQGAFRALNSFLKLKYCKKKRQKDNTLRKYLVTLHKPLMEKLMYGSNYV